jgi:RHS repeat-associated protein
MAQLARIAVVDGQGEAEPETIPMPTQWDQISYTYDPAGRRIEKKYDTTTVVKYVYDGSHCLAEYDGNNQLLRKYIYGPCVDEPICMIEVADSNAVSYYHFDALGSVIALSGADGNTAVLYEYSVYGQVAASDPNHPNRFMFTGREFDADTGLYYYRARYYHPEIGRFLQTDPIGYGDGMNLYTYCHDNPVRFLDPTGTDIMTLPTYWVAVLPGQFALNPAGWPPGILGVAINVGNLMTLAAPEAAGVLGLAYAALSAIQMNLTTNYGWHAYLEVADYNDRNGDGVIDWLDLYDAGFRTDRDGDGDIDGDDVISSDLDRLIEFRPKRWIEVQGVLTKEHQAAGAWYIEVAGYQGNSPKPGQEKVWGFEAALAGAIIAANSYPSTVDREYMDKGVDVECYGQDYFMLSSQLRDFLLYIIGFPAE